jgi:hypothetical protein
MLTLEVLDRERAREGVEVKKSTIGLETDNLMRVDQLLPLKCLNDEERHRPQDAGNNDETVTVVANNPVVEMEERPIQEEDTARKEELLPSDVATSFTPMSPTHVSMQSYLSQVSQGTYVAPPGVILRLHEACTVTFKGFDAVVKLDPESMNSSSMRLLSLSSQSLFLWGESFSLANLDFIAEWSYELPEAILQFLVDISLNIIHRECPTGESPYLKL